MFESDADRLENIKSLGGQLIASDRGNFWGIFDREYLSSDGVVESTHPAITGRTIDVSELPKDTLLTIGTEELRIKRHEPDGSGMTLLILKR